MKNSYPSQLKNVLAETYTLYLQTQWCHWNIVGEHFFSLHEAFGEQYAEQAEAIDEIAEQIRQLGEQAPGSFAEFAKLSSFAQDETAKRASEMLTILIDQQKNLLKTIRMARESAQKAGDEATTDLLIARERAHSKQLWMLESSAA